MPEEAAEARVSLELAQWLEKDRGALGTAQVEAHISLLEQCGSTMDSELSCQFPTAAVRVVYTKAGTNLGRVRHSRNRQQSYRAVSFTGPPSTAWKKPGICAAFSTAKPCGLALNNFRLKVNGAHGISTSTCSTCRFHGSTSPTVRFTVNSLKCREKGGRDCKRRPSERRRALYADTRACPLGAWLSMESLRNWSS